MTPVLHATDAAWRAVLDGSPILPIEGRPCEWCYGDKVRPTIDAATGRRSVDPCPVCWDLLPPVLSGRIAVAVDGAIVGTATAEEVLPVTTHANLGDPECIVVHADGSADHCIPGDPGQREAFGAAPPDGAFLIRSIEHAEALDLRPGGWVVLLSDAAPTTERCPNPDCGKWHCGTPLPSEPCPTCGDEDCPPVPVESAPAGTVTTWEAG